MILFGYFLLYPIGYGWVSLTRWKLPAQPQYIGLDNYRSLLDDGLFRTSLENTIFFVLVNSLSRSSSRSCWQC